MTDNSFRKWLIDEIKSILGRKSHIPPLLLWCDPNEDWLKILQAASEHDGFELWAGANEPELIIRDAFYKEERKPRVVRLSCSREDITWFKVFELEAAEVWEKSLLQALKQYGAPIQREQESEIVPMLRALALEWFDKPKSTWKGLTAGSAKSTGLNDDKFLELLAGEKGAFANLKKDDKEKFNLFGRRCVEDFGFPDPSEMKEKDWRIQSTARLLATEAAEHNPQNIPAEGDNIIPKGLQRTKALSLLNSWKSNINYLESFEKLVKEADKTLGLPFWARSLSSPAKSYSSRAVEIVHFNQIVEDLDKIEEIELLANELEKNLQVFQDRTQKDAFWERSATDKIGWSHLLKLAESARDLVETNLVEQDWKSVTDAIEWYINRGWILDKTGESLFSEMSDLPDQLQRIRARLKRGYLRKVDHIGSVFSNLLTKADEIQSMQTSGEVVLEKLEKDDIPTAIIFIDALSYYLGQSLKLEINDGEPSERAFVYPAIAPVPSITALGMAFALPIKRDQIKVDYVENFGGFQVSVSGFQGNLVVAENRRKWLKQKFGVKDFLHIADVLDSDKLKPASKSRRFIVVEGQELDKQGHEGELELEGTSKLIDRYARVIRRLRDNGYNRVMVVTDHGYFHWQPEPHEIQKKPEGEILWLSRRAAIGNDLKHPEAVKLPVPCSNLEVMVPRGVNAFQTYGGLGYFHGGASLQEIILPVIVAKWPVTTSKVPVVLKPVVAITSLILRVQVEAGKLDPNRLIEDVDIKQVSRKVHVKIKTMDSGKLVFKSEEPVLINPGGKAETVKLTKVELDDPITYGSKLRVVVQDFDNEEILAEEEITLKVDLDEY